MAFAPNVAGPVPIILHHTASDTATPSLLYAGETAVAHGPTKTKLWVGDGTTNRLLLSTDAADGPLLIVPSFPLSVANGGIPAGGAQYQVLGKSSAADRAVTWQWVGARPGSNVAVGQDAGGAGQYNVAVGRSALADVASGSVGNVAVGWQALTALTTSQYNVAVGLQCLHLYTDITSTTAIGYQAGFTGILPAVTQATDSVFVGHHAAPQGNAQTNQIVIGADTKGRGSNTVTLGSDAITQLWCGGINVLASILPPWGSPDQYLAKVSWTDRDVEWRSVGDRGDFSTSVGRFALTIVGSANTAIGFGAAEQRTGNGNTAVGLGSLSLGAGDANVGIGTSTLVSASGNNNVVIGHSAGTHWGPTGTNAMTSADLCTYVGSGIRPSAAIVTNEIVLGARVLGRGSNTVTLGDGAITQLWCGGKDLLAAGAGAGIPEPSTAGSFLRTDTGTWVAGLPLAGGTLTGSLTVGAVTGLAVTGPAVNVADWYYVNGLPIIDMRGFLRDKPLRAPAAAVASFPDSYTVTTGATITAGFLSDQAVIAAAGWAITLAGTAVASLLVGLTLRRGSEDVASFSVGAVSGSITSTFLITYAITLHPGDLLNATISVNNVVGGGADTEVQFQTPFDLGWPPIVPDGGTFGQVLTKGAGAAYGWVTAGVPSGGTQGQVLTRGTGAAYGWAAPPGIPEPTVAGNYLRSNTGTWVAGLPLSGGTLQAATGAPVLTISNSGANPNNAALSATSLDEGPAIGVFANGGYSLGLLARASGVGANAILARTGAGSDSGVNVLSRGAYGIYVDNQTGIGIEIEHSNSAQPAFRINNTATGSSFDVRSGATSHFIIGANGSVSMSPAFVTAMRTALGI